MTEEDTFRTLRRVSLKEAMAIYYQLWDQPTALRLELNNVGWSLQELTGVYTKHMFVEAEND